LEDILQLWGPEDITKEDIRTGLQRWNIKFTEDDLNNVFNRLRFPGNETDYISRVERYANGHLFPIYQENRSAFLTYMA
jgi:hypothetical protein